MTYQAAHDDFSVSRSCSRGSRCGFGGWLGLSSRFSDSSDGSGLCSFCGRATLAVATRLTARADNLIKSLIKLSRHDDLALKRGFLRLGI